MELCKLADEELISLFTSGNTHAFDILASRYSKKIYQSILTVIKDRNLAEDIMQDAFIKIIKSLNHGKYKHEDKFCPWALRVARNLCLDHIRKQKHSVVKTNLENQPVISSGKYYEESHELKVITNQNCIYLYEMLNYLPAEQREVIVFRHFKDMSFKEIAVLTNCSINTAIGRMRYGLLNLRKLSTNQLVA